MLQINPPKINYFLWNESLSDLLYSWKFIKPRYNGGWLSKFAGNSAQLPSDIINSVMLPAQRFWRETVSSLDVVWPRSNQWESVLLGIKIPGHSFQELNSAIHRINRYQADKKYENQLRYPLDSYLSRG